MALTKADAIIFGTLQINLSPSASSTSSSWIDVQSSYSVQVNLKLTNGTSITVGAKIKIEVASRDPGSGGIPADYTPEFLAVTTNSVVTSWSIELPLGVEFFRVTVTHPTYTGTVSTLDAEYTKVTAIT